MTKEKIRELIGKITQDSTSIEEATAALCQFLQKTCVPNQSEPGKNWELRKANHLYMIAGVLIMIATEIIRPAARDQEVVLHVEHPNGGEAN